MRMQIENFEYADKFRMSISIYPENIKPIQQRIKKSIFCTQNAMHVHARACIFMQNECRSANLLMIDYHPGKFHIDPFSSFREHSRTKIGGKKKKKKKKKNNNN